jgi:hypothetical protein
MPSAGGAEFPDIWRLESLREGPNCFIGRERRRTMSGDEFDEAFVCFQSVQDRLLMKQCGMLPREKESPADGYDDDDDDGELEGSESGQAPTDNSAEIALQRGSACAEAQTPAKSAEALVDATDDLLRSLSATDTLRRLSLLSASSSSDDERTVSSSKAKLQSQQPTEPDDEDYSNVLPFLLSLQGDYSQF